MNVIALKALRDFWSQHRDAEAPLRAWHREAEQAVWRTPADIKDRYADASILPRDRVVFNIGGNKYRLVVKVKYRYKQVYIRFVGTHAEYDRIDAETI